MISCLLPTPMLQLCIDHLKLQPPWLLLPISLGFFTLLKNTTLLLQWIYNTFLRSSKNNLKNYGTWALITGSTDGIGKAFAFQLAQHGLNVVLVSRNPDKLTQVSTEIREKYQNIQVKTVAINFSDENIVGGLNEMEKTIDGLDIGVLINNVGVTYPGASYFHEVEESVWMNLVKVNVRGTSLVSMAVVKGMIRRKKGAIVNIGSGASIVVPSHPLYAIYAATKA